MPEKKRPRRTRERILETALGLFNREGEPHVTTADIADEMNISPGNLYYHFRNKDEIIDELYSAYEARIQPLLASPAGRPIDASERGGRSPAPQGPTPSDRARPRREPSQSSIDAEAVEDLWLLLHLVFEQMWAYRFLYRDIDELTSRNRRLGLRFGELLKQSAATMVEFCRGMVAAGSMRATESEIAATARNVVVVATYAMSFHRLTHRAPGQSAEFDIGSAAYHAMALIAPYLVGDARDHLRTLGHAYL